jgi:hypothetical protein
MRYMTGFLYNGSLDSEHYIEEKTKTFDATEKWEEEAREMNTKLVYSISARTF